MVNHNMDSPALGGSPICVNGRPVEELDVVIKRRTKSQGSISGFPLRSPVVTRAESEKSISLAGWVSLCENEEFKPDKTLWSFKYACYCPETRKLTITPGPLEEDVFLEGGTPKSEQADVSNTRPNSSRPRLESQSSKGVKQFLSKRLMTRSRSVGSKWMSPKSESAPSPKSPNGIWSWRSQESGDESFEDEDVTINLVELNHVAVRSIHPSVSLRPHCFQVQTQSDTKYIACSSEEEYHSWLTGLKDLLFPNRDASIRLDTSLSIWIVEAKGVPHRKRYFCELMLDKILYARTSVKYKHEMLFWGEQFSFDDLPPIETLTISLFRESDTKRKKKQDKNVFVGSSVVDLFVLPTNTEIEKWIPVYVPGISPKLNQKTSVNHKHEQPNIRMKLKYDTVVVLPLESYKEFHEFIRESYLTVTKALETAVSVKTKDKLAQTLLRIMHATGETQKFLVDLIMNEVRNTENENLTFRSNTLATKSIDGYMKMVGKNYLQETLGGFVSYVYDLEEETEVDPEKISSGGSTLAENQKVLLKIIEDVWRPIQASLAYFPKELQMIFYLVRQQCQTLSKEDVATKLISASVFLRFLCPAILSPSLFQLTQEYPNEKAARTLTLVAKTIQNLANFTRFGGKESYMEILNSFVESHMPKMEKFLKDVSVIPKPIEKSSFTGSVDLGRELSVLHHLLCEEFTKLPQATAEKLESLKPILDSLQDVYSCSSSVEELRLSKRIANATDVYKIPLATPGNTPSPSSLLVSPATEPSPSQPSDLRRTSLCRTPEYDDSPQSCVDDYVSGCSLFAQKSSAISCPSNRVVGRLSEKDSLRRVSILEAKAKRPQLLKTGSVDFFTLTLPADKENLYRTASLQESVMRSSSHSRKERRGDSSSNSGSRCSTPSKQPPTQETVPQNIPQTMNSPDYRSHRKMDGMLGKGYSNMTPVKEGESMGSPSVRRADDDSLPSPGYLSPPHRQRRHQRRSEHLSNDWSHFCHHEHIRKLSEGRSNLRKYPKLERRHSDLPRTQVQRDTETEGTGASTILLQAQGTEIAQIHPNGFCEILHQGNVERSNSFQSSCSSCSYSSLSYSSVEELNPYGIYIEGDSIADYFSVHDDGTTDFTHDSDLAVERAVTMENPDRYRERNTGEREEENLILRRQLMNTQKQLSQSQDKMGENAKNFEETVLHLKNKLQEADQKMKQQKIDTDEQMKSVINRLVLVESEWRKEQLEMEEIVKAKQKIIEVQEKRIQTLDATNARLVKALTQTTRTNSTLEPTVNGHDTSVTSRHNISAGNSTSRIPDIIDAHNDTREERHV